MPRTHYCPRCLTTFTEQASTCPNLGCGAPAPDPWPTLLQPGDLLDRTYRITRRLAGGAAGMTYLARELGDGDVAIGPELAIKVLYAERDTGPFVQRLATEARILQSLEHPNILECRGFVHRLGRPPYLITRFEPGGTLFEHIARVGPLSPRVAARILLQVVDALRVAHAADVIHRDLKPANVLLRSQVRADEVPSVRLADFGIAKVQGSLSGLTRVGAFVGTPEYAAPEQFLGEAPTPSADLFAAAGILCFLLTGAQPLRITQRHDALHTHDEVIAQIPPQLPAELRATEAGLRLQDVLDGWMLADPSERADVQTGLDALEDAAEADDAGSLPSSAPVVGTGGTVFVDAEEEEPTTFIWDGTAPVEPVEARSPTLVAPPAPAELEAQTPTEPARPRPPPSDSTLEGLFDFGASSTPARPAPAPSPPQPSLPPGSLFDEHAATPASAAPASLFDEAADGDTSSPALVEALAEHASRDAPISLPVDPMRILGLLGKEEHTASVQARLQTWSDSDARGWLRQARKHPEPATRIGALRAIVHLERSDLASQARSALRDPIPSVRAEAATTLGDIGTGSLLASLPRLLSDEAPAVRAAAAHAIAAAYTRTDAVDPGLRLLDQHGTDPDADVRAALTQARHSLRQSPR